MLGLVRKRHDGDGWIVFSELSNRASGPGDRYADAFALGCWASTKYEAHLYEFKASRQDLKKELAQGAVKLRELSGHTECAPNCRSRSQWGKGQCSCGAQPLSEVERDVLTQGFAQPSSD